MAAMRNLYKFTPENGKPKGCAGDLSEGSKMHVEVVDCGGGGYQPTHSLKSKLSINFSRKILCY
jgi:hypothetical protein